MVLEQEPWHAQGEGRARRGGRPIGGVSAQGEGSATEVDRAPIEVRRDWARLIRKVYEVDPLICPQCGRTIEIVLLIEKPAVLERILKHLTPWPTDDASRAPPSPASSRSSRSEQHYEPLFDDLPWEEPTFEDARFAEDGEPTSEADGASDADDVSADSMDGAIA